MRGCKLGEVYIPLLLIERVEMMFRKEMHIMEHASEFRKRLIIVLITFIVLLAAAFSKNKKAIVVVIPLVLLYEFGITLSKVVYRKKLKISTGDVMEVD